MNRAVRIRAVLIMVCTLVLSVAFAGCSSPARPGNSQGPGYTVEWADAGMEQAVRKQLEKPEGAVNSNELGGLKIVHIWPDRVQFNNGDPVVLDEGTAVEKADDLVHFKNLGGVLLSDFYMENLDVLRGLDTLQRVVLNFNSKLTDISVLAELPKLNTLVVHNNSALRDFSPIGQCAELRELDLHACALEDISFLEPLTHLKVVVLSNNEITDITPLRNSTNIQELSILGNRVEDIGVLANFSLLFNMQAQGNQISDLTPLKDLADMRRLHLDQNQISDLTPLEGLQDLRKLTLDSNPLVAAEVAALRMKLPSSCEIVWTAK